MRSALLRGDRVIATVRSLSSPDLDDDPVPSHLEDNLRRIELDVTEGEDALRFKVDAAAGIWGRIDVLVNNAGNLHLNMASFTNTVDFSLRPGASWPL